MRLYLFQKRDLIQYRPVDKLQELGVYISPRDMGHNALYASVYLLELYPIHLQAYYPLGDT